MSKNACTPDNVIGMMFAHRVNDGLDLSIDTLKEVDRFGQSHFIDVRNKTFSEALSDAPGNTQIEADNQVITFIAGDKNNNIIHSVKAIFSELRNPSGLFGEDFIAPVTEFITKHYEDHMDDLAAGRSAYKSGIKDVFDSLPVDELSHSQKVMFDQYKRFYLDGGELYNLNSRSAIERTLGNVSSNVIKSSPNVLIGNVLEAAIKLPTLYPKEFLPAIIDAVKANPFKELPDIAKTGAYGLDFAGEAKGKWAGLIGLTDKPLKNIAYFAGERAGTGGSYAVQKVAFTPRFGDLPPVYYHAGGNAAIKMLGYTINSHRMYAGMWKGLANPKTAMQSLQQLVTYHGLLGLMGGATATIPFGGIGQSMIEHIMPDSAYWFEENKTFLTKLIQPGTLSRFGIGFDIASRTTEKIQSSIDKASVKLFEDGDIGGAAIDYADAALSSMLFSNGFLGDNQVQKALRMAKDVAMGELDFEDIPQEALDKYVPAMDIQLDQ